MTKFSKTQRGFTLIEMSIVLVIIGLIVGGILKGQELIESSRQKNAMSQIDRVRSGVTTFVDRYRAYPGDYSHAQANINTKATNGNDNGFVGADQTSMANLLAGVNGATGENMNFFNHLVASELLGGGGLIDGTGAAGAFSGSGTNSPLPQSAFPNSGLTIAYGLHEGGAAVQTAHYHWLRMSKYENAGLAAADAIISGQRAQQLDTKFDDGQPMTGVIRTTGTTAVTAGACGTAGTDNGYVGTDTALSCVLLFQLN